MAKIRRVSLVALHEVRDTPARPPPHHGLPRQRPPAEPRHVVVLQNSNSRPNHGPLMVCAGKCTASHETICAPLHMILACIEQNTARGPVLWTRLVCWCKRVVQACINQEWYLARHHGADCRAERRKRKLEELTHDPPQELDMTRQPSKHDAPVRRWLARPRWSSGTPCQCSMKVNKKRIVHQQKGWPPSRCPVGCPFLRAQTIPCMRC